jgi:hypothetical protein
VPDGHDALEPSPAVADLRKKLRPVIAIHEAAHVVVGLHHDMPFEHVSLFRQPGKSEGHVRPIQSGNPGGYHCHHIMPTYAAGAIAQDIATGCRDRITTAQGSRSDFTEVRECARLVRQAQLRGEDTCMDLSPRATVRKIAEVAWAGAYRIVVDQYGAIQAIADALLNAGRYLTQDDCERIIAGAGQVEPPAIAHLAEQFWPPFFMPGWWVPAKRAGRTLVASAAVIARTTS